MPDGAPTPLVRVLACGDVDHGKSTLVGRLLHDSGALFDDQLQSLRRESARRGRTAEPIDFSLAVDGLKAERDEGRTIDVAYRHLSTPRRRLILADVPGHDQYTRNMVTAASQCDLAIVVVDVTRGVLRQTRRHGFLADLLRVDEIVVAVNKMDLTGYDEAAFTRARSELGASFSAARVHFVATSGLRGDNVVTRSEHMPWYRGRTLLELLETARVEPDRTAVGLRFPVQLVLGSERGPAGARRYAGSVASGILRKGAEVAVLPSGRRVRIGAIETFDGELEQATACAAVVVRIDDADLARGDMLADPGDMPRMVDRFEAMLVWMDEASLVVGRAYLLKRACATVRAVVRAVAGRVDVDTRGRIPGGELCQNDIGQVTIEASQPLALDPYARSRTTGSFILIDAESNATAAAGIILG